MQFIPELLKSSNPNMPLDSMIMTMFFIYQTH